MNDGHRLPAEAAARRLALRRALGLGLGIAATVAAKRARAATGKLTKEAVRYSEIDRVPGKDCDDCSQYLAGPTAKGPASCRIVDGPIDPHGHCIAFSPKPKG